MPAESSSVVHGGQGHKLETTMTEVETTAEAARNRIKTLPEVISAQTALELSFEAIEDLRIHPGYQRRISQQGLARITKMVQDFSWSRFGALSVACDDDGNRWVVDGQHRLIAARALRITTVPCAMTRGDLRGQAGDFVGINTVRTTVASIDKFRARVAQGDKVALKVAKMLEDLEISTDVPAGHGLKPNETRAVSKLEKLMSSTGDGVVFTALETLMDAQPGQRNLLTAFNIEATVICVARMLEAKRPLERLDTVLRETDFDTIKEEAAQLLKLQGGQLARHGTERLLARVNKGLREKVA